MRVDDVHGSLADEGDESPPDAPIERAAFPELDIVHVHAARAFVHSKRFVTGMPEVADRDVEPGAIPPLMGWTAATNELSLGGWIVFGILFLWQLPHFLAIAWMFRRDYADGGFPMLPVTDPDGRRTGRQAVLYAAALVPVALLPTVLGLTGAVYFAGALVLSLAFLAAAAAFAAARTDPAARRLLLVSVLYLPSILAVMLVDRVV